MKDLYYVERFALRWRYVLRWMICTTLNDLYYVEWFLLCWMICTMLNDFLLRYKICTTSNDLYNQGIIQRWKNCTTFNDSDCDGWFVQRWIIWTTISYWVSAFKWVPDVLIRENTVRYFALTSELIFPWFGNIKKKYIRFCPRNWPYMDFLITLVETIINIFSIYI